MEVAKFEEWGESERGGGVNGVFSSTMDEPRLIVTSEQLLQIKIYVKKGQDLPVERKGIEALLGGVIDHPDFEWADIKELHESVKAHANTWSPIEERLQLVCGDVGGFADGLVDFGKGLINDIEQMPVTQRVKDYGSLELKDIPFIPFDKDDEKVHSELGKVFVDLKESVRQARQSTDDLKVEVNRFHRVLSDKLTPLVGDKIKKINSIDPSISIIEFRNELARIELDIEQANRELIKHAAETVLRNLDGFSVIINAIFSSPKEAVLGKHFIEAGEKVARFQREKSRLIELIAGQEKLPGLIARQSDALTDLSRYIRSAENASHALVLVWNSVLAEIDKSASELGLIKDGVSLIRFQQSFKRGIAPWNEVKKLADVLLSALKSAISDFNEQQAIRQEGGVV